MKKNQSGQIIGCQMTTKIAGSDFDGGVTVYVTKDGGTQTIGSVGSGVCTDEGRGFFTYAPAQAETDADHIAFTFVGTGAFTVTVQLYTTIDATLTADVLTDIGNQALGTDTITVDALADSAITAITDAISVALATVPLILATNSITNDVVADEVVTSIQAAVAAGTVELSPTSQTAVAAEVMASEGDTGITLTKLAEMMAAFMAGKVSSSTVGDVTTYTYKKRDGSTTSFTTPASNVDGTRATTGALS